MSSKRDRFAGLLAPLRGPLEATCRHLIWDRSKAEDCLQTAILEAYAGFDRFEEGTNFRAWIHRYLWNTVMNYNRRYQRIRKMEGSSLPSEPCAEAFDPGEGLHETALTDPERLLDLVDERLRRAILGLNRPERAVLILRAISGLSYREISETLEIPLGSVMGYLHRARRRLREDLAVYAEEVGMVKVEGGSR